MPSNLNTQGVADDQGDEGQNASQRMERQPILESSGSAETRAQALEWIQTSVTAAYDRARNQTADLAELVERAYETVLLGHYAPLVAVPELRREAYERLRELRSALHRFQNALERQPLARLEQGRGRRAAEDGRGSGPLPLGYRLGSLDEARTSKGARGARWFVELEPRGARIVRRIYELRALQVDPVEIATVLFQEGLGFPAKQPQQELSDRVRAAQRAGRQNEVEQLQREMELRPSERFLGRLQVEQVLRHEDLYRNGRRIWNGIEARVRWPIVLTD